MYLVVCRRFIEPFRREILAAAKWTMLDQLRGHLLSASAETAADKDKVQSGNCARVQAVCVTAGDVICVFLSAG